MLTAHGVATLERAAELQVGCYQSAPTTSMMRSRPPRDRCGVQLQAARSRSLHAGVVIAEHDRAQE
jgi:hypothetical protein